MQATLLSTDPYTTALAFIRGELEVEGDLVNAVRQCLGQTGGAMRRVSNLLGRLAPWRLADLWRTRAGTAQNIRFHYDRSNDFYQHFLDRRMVYSCAYFRRPGETLEEAQLAKLDHICRKLQLRRGQRFLDIGCGWGALVRHAAREYGAEATGCTLSHQQTAFAIREAASQGVPVAIEEMDYRDMHGGFDRIASVGMFEHVGAWKLRTYFRKVSGLLAPDGLFLNHGITRPAGVPTDATSLFIARHVFPGGRIHSLGEVVESAENAGLEILDIENLRRHYALTCREWVRRLRANREACLKTVDEQTWRV